ncbi:MAG TPA: hypothetical protein VHM48_08000 [Candidatus Limnocylindrales bacterium]|nr:hypothetical protein [Candidatus Limnocylindrales bacterium]
MSAGRIVTGTSPVDLRALGKPAAGPHAVRAGRARATPEGRLVGGVDIDPMLLYAVITIAFLVLGILALGYGVDSRDGFEDDDWRRRS